MVHSSSGSDWSWSRCWWIQSWSLSIIHVLQQTWPFPVFPFKAHYGCNLFALSCSWIRNQSFSNTCGLKLVAWNGFNKRERGNKTQSRNSKYLLFSVPRNKTKPSWDRVSCRLTDAVLLVPVQSVSRSAVTLESSHGVFTDVSTASVIHAALINVWQQRAKRNL